jgi:two-component system sensor kinase FixL
MPLKEAATKRPWPLAGRNCLADSPEARVRLAATTYMASSLAHEVSEPLTAAANYLFACARRLRDMGEDHAELLALIEKASGETLKAGEIIRRTRNFVVSGRIAVRRENLRTMVERALLRLGERREAIGITTGVPLELFVKADRIQLEQLLASLLLNACAALAGRTDGWIEIEAEQDEDEIVLQIADNGPGLPEAALARLAGPAPANDDAGTETGFGLAIAAAIAEAHGGRLRAENGPNGGAIFRVTLPVAAD